MELAMHLTHTCLTLAQLQSGSDYPLLFSLCTDVLFGVLEQDFVGHASLGWFDVLNLAVCQTVAAHQSGALCETNLLLT